MEYFHWVVSVLLLDCKWFEYFIDRWLISSCDESVSHVSPLLSQHKQHRGRWVGHVWHVLALHVLHVGASRLRREDAAPRLIGHGDAQDRGSWTRPSTPIHVSYPPPGKKSAAERSVQPGVWFVSEAALLAPAQVQISNQNWKSVGRRLGKIGNLIRVM